MRFRLIEDYREIWPVRVMCKALSVSPSGYYAWRSRPDSPRKIANRGLLVVPGAAHGSAGCRYGAPRIHAELRAEGQTVSRKRVERVMRQHALRARAPRRHPVCTTDSKHCLPVAANLLEQGRLDLQGQFSRDRDLPFVPISLQAISSIEQTFSTGWQVFDGLQNSFVILGIEPMIGLRRDHGRAQLPCIPHEGPVFDAEPLGRVTSAGTASFFSGLS
jgi:putative transposase